MRFTLSTEQVDFAASLRTMLADAKTPDTIRAWGAGELDAGRALLGRLADAGVMGLGIAEEFGGLGAHPVDTVVAFVEIGRAGVPGPLVESAAAIPALLQALPDSSLAQKWLPGIAEGTTLASLVLSPSVPRALDGDIADVIFHVDGDALRTGDATTQVASVDAARRLFETQPSDVLTEDIGAAADSAFDHGALACAAQLHGAGQAVLDLSTEYVRNRVQFGRPIGQFQAIKHHLADAKVHLDMAAPLLHGAAVAVAADSPTASRAISAAKVACGDATYLASRKALQVHGAIGYTAEYDLSLWLTKIRALVTAWGTPTVHRARIAESLRATS
ncbi:acyl-CoA dehydrogenase family protein [Antrihabitans cavernicola]|uniref:Acyl-CoA dehydrogenase n=1 Tax=Antrihabitans cavernicola TaxID=2495913 RepID=A0A5A7S7T9_9NOCA|nr:acyl-CoA dehydrogenase family protein [Spelaeibacter cavernicola]KAA0021976.1 acyl-CoA dehydrogenase [Spelaeibacter cavernicola]